MSDYPHVCANCKRCIIAEVPGGETAYLCFRCAQDRCVDFAPAEDRKMISILTVPQLVVEE